MARRRLKDAAEQAAADAAVESLVEHPQAAGKSPSPYSVDPRMVRFRSVVSTIVDEARGVDIDAEFEELERRLRIDEALTPEVIRREQNEVDHLAWRAHRLYVLARVALEQFDFEAGIAVAAMHEQAIVGLQVEKASGLRTKQITEKDVEERAATLYPDEVRDIQDRKIKARKTVESLENLAERWARRSWTLSSMAGS